MINPKPKIPTLKVGGEFVKIVAVHEEVMETRWFGDRNAGRTPYYRLPYDFRKNRIDLLGNDGKGRFMASFYMVGEREWWVHYKGI